MSALLDRLQQELNTARKAQDRPLTLVIGLQLLNAPFKGGVLQPTPDLLIAGLQTDGAGGLVLSGTWPAGLPTTLEVIWQAWIADAGASHGYAATNGLRSVAPW